MSSLPEPPPPPPVDFYSILFESKRILSAHRRHFLGLSVLFLLPLSFSSNIYLSLSSQFNHHSQSLLRHHSPTTTTNANTTVSLLYYVVSLFFSTLSVGTISFSVYHISLGRRPVKLVSSILSLLRSFLPLLSTSLASLLLQSLTFLAFGLILFLIIGFELTVFKIDQSSPFLFSSLFILGVLLLLVLMYLKVSWALAYTIAVVESSWGFEPLRRSTKLVAGMRRLVLSLMVFNGVCSGALVFGCSFLGDGEFDGDIRSWKSWLFVLRTVVSTGGFMVIMLIYFVANTVLYMYCKAVHGEVVAGDQEVDGEYVSLPFDDGKVHYIISVAQNNELGMP